MFFVGIDLAWSERNGSGVAIVKADKTKGIFYAGSVLYSDKDIIDYVEKYVGSEPAFIAIDAPLIVPNKTGRRIAEKLVGEKFRQYDAGAHPANRTRLSQWTGKIRGEEISDLLAKNGFRHSPNIRTFENSRKFFEVYPHPSMVVLFDLERILRYKAKPNRDYAFRWKEFQKYQNYLQNLKTAKPGLHLPTEVFTDVKKLKGQKLKNYEDLLDSIFCAYIAYYAWTNPEKCEVLGNMKEGYILTPVKQ